MYNRQLDTFLAVAENGSISGAAAELFITPSAVIQQINSLEESLGVTLFSRTHQGVTLTKAGRYLVREGSALIRRSNEIREQLLALQQKESKELHIGTALLQRCRLFYPLWSRFDAEHPGCSVRIQNFGNALTPCRSVDLIEALKDGEAWQSEYSFLPLCRVPLVCAVPRDHPLAGKASLTMDDLRSNILVTIRPGLSEELDRFRTDMQKQGVRVLSVDQYDLSTFTLCNVNHYVLQTPACWQDIHPDLITVPCSWDYSLPYGFFTRADAAEPAARFLAFVKEQLENGTIALPDYALT